jgi:hypothetical protein
MTEIRKDSENKFWNIPLLNKNQALFQRWWSENK